MAQGAGRGWFHRKRSQPATEEPMPGTVHVNSTVAPGPPSPTAESSPTTPPPAEPGSDVVRDHLEWSPEQRRATPELDRADARPPVTPLASPAVAPPASVPAPVDAVASPHVQTDASASTNSTAASAEPTAFSTPRPGIDWDAATAAALSDEPDSVTPAASSPSAAGTQMSDRLLEDLIREIVGDAVAETASSLHPSRPEDSTDSTSPKTEVVPRQVRSERPASSVIDAATPKGRPASVADAAADVDVDGSVQAPLSENPDPASADQVPPDAVAPQESPAPDRVATTPTRQNDDVAADTVREDIDVSRETSHDYGGTPLAYELADETRRRVALDEAVLPLPAATRILTISNQKGGVGKTTTAVNLAAALARAGARVLVVDLDPQGNASTALGVDHRSEQRSVYEVLVADLPLGEVVRPSTEHENLDCVPATIHLAGAEIELVSLVAREQRLRRALDTHLASMERPYDYVFIDCPPSLGLLTINAFVAAREVLIPIQCEYYALEGLSQLLSNIELIEKHLNADLRLSTILLTMYDSRTNLAQQVAQEVRDHFPVQTLETIIPRSVRVSEAPSYGQSVISYDFASSGSLSYREAAAEIARRGAPKPEESH
ncbi:cellulose biosynthesis protein BcsQ [Agromyces ramosus]|uniref:Cellulose biosynthesis protein BcsQ n=1 Tax=Agromyces ramosus TaxID=33879 RepID=A0ABU0R7K6_9MICO|nr:cellulose biosynthesis protein BcsQ [Agromyces ramosus]